MKRFFYTAFLIFIFQGKVNALKYTIYPNPAMEGQQITFSLLYFCGEYWSNPNVSLSGSDVNIEISYHYVGCPIGVPPPGGYENINLGSLTAGDYQINLTVLDSDDQSILLQEIIPFGVLPIKKVPVAANFMYLIIISLTLLIGVFGYASIILKRMIE